MQFDLSDLHELIIENEIYAPWPRFSITAAHRLMGVMACDRVREILISDDLFCWAWRTRIPRDVLKLVVRFPEAHADLLVLAQSDPDAFVRLAQDNPAVLVLIATEQFHRRDLRVRISSVRRQLLRAKRRQVLSLAGWSASRALVRLCAKIPISECHPILVHDLLSVSAERRVRRILSHLPMINEEVVWLLRGRPPILDSQFLLLAAREPTYRESRIRDIVTDIWLHHPKNGDSPWPFRGVVRSWQSLERVAARTIGRGYRVYGPLPNPPLSVNDDVLPEGLSMIPLNSVLLLVQERQEMNNCSLDHLGNVVSGDAYLYRLLEPERATVLVSRLPGGRWEVAEAMIASNERDVTEWSFRLLQTWTRLSCQVRKS